MKKLLSIISLAALLGPAVALADEANEAVQSPHAAMFQQLHAKMAQLHAQARTQILASLTPAHKTALANIVGQLAIAANPDPAAAVRQIDAMLSVGEKQAIIRTHDAVRTQARGLMEAAHKQMASSMPAGMEHVRVEAKENEAQETPDAGRILLMMAVPKPSHEGMMHHEM
jgi:hypothetical protein